MNYFGKTLAVGGALVAMAAAFAQEGAAPPAAVEGVEEVEEVEEVNVNDEPPAAEPACFNAGTVRNFDGLDDQHVYVEGANNQHYLLTMNQRCLGLSTAETIAITNPSMRVCSNSLAELTYVGTGGRAETCWISQVEAVEDKPGARRVVELRRSSSR